MQKHNIYIGTSGWSYPEWKGRFYPSEVPAKSYFAYYIRHFNTVEINNTFYRLPKKETIQIWKDAVPDDFVYVIKASRYITHIKKLHQAEESFHEFFNQIAALEQKVGAVLFQLPPSLKINYELLENFLEELPPTYRYVFEFRHPDWYQPEIYSLLEKHNCAFCIYDLEGKLSPVRVTADFVYVRLHGPKQKYVGNYSEEFLSEWAQLCREWLVSHDVFVYFDNTAEGYAAFNALRLMELIND